MKKKRKKGKVEKKSEKKRKSEKKEESIVDYCCNPQCIWVWGNNDFPTPFSFMYEMACPRAVAGL
jgi:succinate dehydrogenase/fumarate reductase-like Fe-S protein